MRDYLESQGAENVVLIDNVVGFDTWKKGVFASGRSLRHIRKMTEGILANVSILFTYDAVFRNNVNVFSRIEAGVLFKSLLNCLLLLFFQQKARKLKRIMGIEGEKDDDWQAIDCHSFLVNVMSPSKLR